MEFFLARVHPDDRPHLLEQREQLHDGRLERATIEYRYLHPERGDAVDAPRRARRRARRVGSRAERVWRAAGHHARREHEDGAAARRCEEIERLKDRLQAESDYLKAGDPEIAGAERDYRPEPRRSGTSCGGSSRSGRPDSSVLVQGETGTGKELVARAIHRLSRRPRHVLVKVNCAALPAGLIESELFGREKGAFTGALTRQVGRFEIADGSTLFLDEIGELPLELQAKLLRVLETGRVRAPRESADDPGRRAGRSRPRTATSARRFAKGRFRSDLYYRLNVFPIRVPPLRERPEDIPLLVWDVPRRALVAHGERDHPGSAPDDGGAPAPLLAGQRPRAAQPRRARRDPHHRCGAPDAVARRDQRAGRLHRRPWPRPSAMHIVRALERAGGQVKGPRGAAAALGINPATLYSRMKKLGIQISRPPRTPTS